MYPKYDHPYNLKDVVFSIKGLFKDYSKELEKELKRRLNVKKIFLIDSGRSCLSLILDSLNIPENSEVAIPVNTCKVVADVIISKNLRPLFIDVTDNLTMSPKDLEKKISSKTKIIIPIYTYGNKYSIDAITRIAKKHKAIIIEDLAQTFTRMSDSAVAGFISLDVAKHVSSFGGGILLTNNLEIQSDKILKRKLEFENIFKIFLFKFLVNNFVYTALTRHLISCIKSFYYYKPKLRQLSKVGTALAFSQIKKLDEINKIRKDNAHKLIKLFDKNYTDEDSTFLFVAVNSNKCIKDIDLPSPVPLLNQLNEYRQYWNSCLKAEKIQNNLVLLPTYKKISGVIWKL